MRGFPPATLAVERRAEVLPAECNHSKPCGWKHYRPTGRRATTVTVRVPNFVWRLVGLLRATGGW